MIPATIEAYIYNDVGAPKVIACDAQLEEYVSALMELDKQSQLSAAERNFAELLIVLIETYVERNNSLRSVSLTGYLQELLSSDGIWRRN